MDRDVVEGNSTSLRSSARFSNPQEPSALMDLSRLNMNDLGLTPFPGFQLGDSTLQDKEQDCFYDLDVVNAAGHHGIEQAYSQSIDKAAGTQISDVEFDPPNFGALGLNEDSYDPLFDSTIPELESVFSRKRTADHDELPPEKRQHLESPGEAPSLTTDSNHDSPASFFDTFDNLFGDGSNLPLPSPDDLLPEFEELTAQLPVSPHKTSESTRERFSLDEQDILSTKIRETFTIEKQPEYTSPYPPPRGPLGYLPSSPGIHMKSVAVGITDKDCEILNLKARLAQLARERDQYKRSLLRYASLNDEGKSPEQVLREENAALRRVSSRRQARIEECMKETADWKDQLHTVSTLYNNLLYEIKVGKRLPNVASIPTGYKPSKPSQKPGPAQSQIGQSGQHANLTATHSQSVTIDLTEDREAPSTPPADSAPCSKALQALRSKKYSWLPAGNETSRSIRTSNDPIVEDDELAQVMEAELSRA